jgi:hypothetical protein
VPRLTWSFATDKGLPFSRFFAHVSRHMFQLIWHRLFQVTAICEE